MLQHIPYHIEQHGISLNCFALERKHKLAKRFMNAHINLSPGWDGQNLRSITEHAWWSLHAAGDSALCPTGLIDMQVVRRRSELWNLIEVPKGVSVHQSRSARIAGGCVCNVGDVVMYSCRGGLRCARILFCLQIASNPVFLLNAFQLINRDLKDARATLHGRTGTREFVPIGDVVAVANCWLQTDCGLRVVSPAWLAAQAGLKMR
jgi:hypothetical protein